MRFYLLTKQIPELEHLPPTERVVTWGRVRRKTYRHWQTWVGLFFCPGLTAAGSYVGKLAGMPYFPMIVGAAFGGLIYGQTIIYVARRYYSGELSAGS